ncbi:hypothetical protein Tco_1171820 [Tanacetum coccineum]
MVGPVEGNTVARRMIDDLVDFSGETSVDGYMRNMIGQLTALVAEMEAFDDPGEGEEEIKMKKAQLDVLFVVYVSTKLESCMELLLVNGRKNYEKRIFLEASGIECVVESFPEYNVSGTVFQFLV